ncbi:MAG: hypothetical protein KDJ65_33360 [Anaerolineae bacterium]|nr:hypothetical protein [Anaerolineae bacterium]
MKPELFKRAAGRGDGNVNESSGCDRPPNDVASPRCPILSVAATPMMPPTKGEAIGLGHPFRHDH